MKYTFKKNGFEILKKVVPIEVNYFCSRYLKLKKQVLTTFQNSKFISPFQKEFGYFDDAQVPNTFSIYGDPAVEVLLVELLPIMEKTVNFELIPTYGYARVYKKRDILNKHKDRYSCEISTTLNLGGDLWPIYINSNEKEGEKGKPSNSKGIKVDLEPGDMLVYKGNILEHWRDKFEGKECFQVFLHYNKKTKDSEKNLFDGRPHLGLPFYFSKKE